MCSEIFSLYNELFKQYKILHNQKSGEQAASDFNANWIKAKAKYSSKEELVKFAQNLLADYQKKNSLENGSNNLSYFPHRRKPRLTEKIEKIMKLSNGIPDTLSEKSNKNDENIIGDSVTTSSDTLKRKAQVLEDENEVIDTKDTSCFMNTHETPVQDKLRKCIALLKVQLAVVNRHKDSINADGEEQAEILRIKEDIYFMEKELHARQQHTLRSKKHRALQRSRLAAADMQKPEDADVSKQNEKPDNSLSKECELALVKTIVELAMSRASADELDRYKILHSCQTLCSLQTLLIVQLGVNISRNDTYVRLLSKRHGTLGGKHHVATVPVKLNHPEAINEKAQPDEHFCTSTVRSLETLASILGPNEVSFVSHDDKASISIGPTAAKKKAPLLMYVEYSVPLADHDSVIAAKQKLIPSVYAGCIIKPDAMDEPEAVTDSGPTYIAIRNSKYSSSVTSSYAIDLGKLTALDSFKEIIRDQTGRVKPVMMISSDGGPDGKTCYPKILASAIHHFTKHELDGLFIFTNAPGRSAFNRVEKRLAPLSRELPGLVLPHDLFGSHLDDTGRIIDTDLQETNFRKAGEVLAEIWNNVVIDGKDVVAEYIKPNSCNERFVSSMPSEDWCSKHVRQSQYLLQVVKCNDGVCCKDHRSSLRCILPDGFLPIPFPIKQSPNGLHIPTPDEHDGKSFASLILRQSLDLAPSHARFTELPYDTYCPSLWSKPELLEDRTCKKCGLYFWSKKAVAAHTIALHRKTRGASDDRVSDEENEESESEDIQDIDIDELESNKLENKDITTFVSIEKSETNLWIDDH